MTLLFIMIIVILATPKEDGPKAQPMKSCIEMLREQPYLTGCANPDPDDE